MTELVAICLVKDQNDDGTVFHGKDGQIYGICEDKMGYHQDGGIISKNNDTH